MCLITFSGLTLLDRSTRYVWFTRVSSFRMTLRRWPPSTWPTTVFCTATSHSTPRGPCLPGLGLLTRCMWRSTWAASWCLCSCLCCLCSGTSRSSTDSSSLHLPPPHSWASPSSLVLLRLGCIAVDGCFCPPVFSIYVFVHIQIHILCTCSLISASGNVFWEFWTLQVCWRLWFQRNIRGRLVFFVFVFWLITFAIFHLHQVYACHR